MFHAKIAEQISAFLHILIDTSLSGVAEPGGIHAFADLRVREANDGCLVKVIEDLRIQAVAVDRQRLKISLPEQRADDIRHVVLGGLKCQEYRRLMRVFKAGRLSSQRPEQVAHAPRQSADGGGSHFASGQPLRAVQEFKIRLLHRALRGEHQDRRCGNALVQQEPQPFGRSCSFTCPCRAVKKQPPVQG